MKQPSQLYCRFTVHREKIQIIKYLPTTKTFLTICKEGDIIFWQLGEERRVNKVRHYRVPSDRKIKKVEIVAPGYHKHRPEVLSDRIIAVFRSGESELFDFEIGGEVQLKEGEEPNPANAHLYLVDNEK